MLYTEFMKPETYLARLGEQGTRRENAKAEAAAAMTEIERLARGAVKAGATKTAVAQAAKISRVTLDEILKS